MILKNARELSKRINDACIASHRTPQSVRMVAISKAKPAARILEAYSCGISDFGENRIQEAQEKIRTLSDRGITWHFVGRLQGNKARKAVKLFDVIHSIDSLDLAAKISKEAEKIHKRQDILLQVNISGEKTKTGFSEGELMQAFPRLLQLGSLSLRGLMTIAPISNDAKNSRPIFRKLRALRDKLEQTHSVSLPELSMGMSQDFGVAIEEGATMIRIGTALFG